ncbi:hypothetical protein EVAR_95529_1 [Eumeta japonica]|uniref:Uncharacterized protein n=1 Tax=Eumeta variegata TaxID=151549 RepID=A0A4C1UK61_EUMVA|nr:hypothetical protein EVAR_95529_1 [Eumeta japonica]
MKEVLSLIYTAKSLEKILNPYVRALRARKLHQLTLAIIDDIEINNETSEALLLQFNQKMRDYEKRGPTANLCSQYFHMVSIAKEFIRAEHEDPYIDHETTDVLLLQKFTLTQENEEGEEEDLTFQ